MAQKAPGKAHRKGLSLIQVMDMFATEEAARDWIESIIWPFGRCCPHCGSIRTSEASHKKMPYWCADCRSYFSVKTGTAMANSKIPLRKWAIAIYLCMTNLKSVSSMKLHRDLNISQKSAWFMLHRIREAWMPQKGEENDPFSGPVEVDETYVGGLESNKHEKDKLKAGRGTVGKTAVIGMRDRATGKTRAKVVPNVDGETMRDFIAENAAPDAKVYTDDAKVYSGLPNDHEVVRHSVGEYLRGKVHTNSIETMWSMLKRAHKGTFHKLSPKHLDRYVQEFAHKSDLRELDTMVQMSVVVSRLFGRTLGYRRLIRDNGLSSMARR